MNAKAALTTVTSLPSTARCKWLTLKGQLREWVADKIIAWAERREPNFIPEENIPWYEWDLIPGNRFFNLCVRKQVDSLPGPKLWFNNYWSLEYHLRGGSHCIVPFGVLAYTAWGETTVAQLVPGQWVFRKASDHHRARLHEGLDGSIPCWTIRFEGRKL